MKNDFLLNTVIASPLVSPKLRWRILRSMGMRIESCAIFSRVFLGGLNIVVRRGVTINHGCFIDDGATVTLEENAGLAMNVSLITSSHEIGAPDRRYGPFRPAPITIGRGAWLGAGVIVQPGVTIGAGCVVMTGSVVSASTEPNGLYGGVPARRIRDLDSEQDLITEPSSVL